VLVSAKERLLDGGEARMRNGDSGDQQPPAAGLRRRREAASTGADYLQNAPGLDRDQRPVCNIQFALYPVCNI
jgi:hypothetical protein